MQASEVGLRHILTNIEAYRRTGSSSRTTKRTTTTLSSTACSITSSWSFSSSTHPESRASSLSLFSSSLTCSSMQRPRLLQHSQGLRASCRRPGEGVPRARRQEVQRQPSLAETSSRDHSLQRQAFGRPGRARNLVPSRRTGRRGSPSGRAGLFGWVHLCALCVAPMRLLCEELIQLL